MVRALHLAATHPAAAGDTFQIATGQATAINALAAAVQRLLRDHGHPAPPVTHVEARPAEVRATVASPAKARERLGWTAEVGLADGLARTYAHLTRQLAGTA